MTDPLDWTPGVQLAIGLLTLAGILLGVGRWALPRYRNARADARAIRDTLVGREAIRDTITGEEIRPAIPGIGARMADQEKHASRMAEEMVILTRAVADLASSQARLDDHERRITAIEQGHHLERLAGKAEAIHLYRAVEAIAKDEADPVDPT